MKNYQQKIDDAVQEAADAGLQLGDITFPLINMLATMVANVTVQNQLLPEEEIEHVHQAIDELFDAYLKAYVDDDQRQTA